jgi:hypothetical protein
MVLERKDNLNQVKAVSARILNQTRLGAARAGSTCLALK